MEDILRATEHYYSEKIRAHGATAQGVDWNSPESQALRFGQLLKVCDLEAGPFSLNDYGCGYGALFRYLHEHGLAGTYCGFDISPAMIEKARALHPEATFVSERARLQAADYTVASGLFNVRQQTDEATWTAYVVETLHDLAALSRRGFSFNVLTKYSDPEYLRPDLYYADPLMLFDYCKQHFSKYVALLHDYPLYEFTILVRT